MKLFNEVVTERLLKAFLKEAVLDAKHRFAQKRSGDLSKKLSSLADELPNAFSKQESQESEVNKLLSDVPSVVDRFVSQKRMRLAAPNEFKDEEWGSNASVFDVVSHIYPRSKSYDEVKQYVVQNRQAFENASAALEEHLSKVERFADAMIWPAPWRRYTIWAIAQTQVQRFVEAVGKMLRV